MSHKSMLLTGASGDIGEAIALAAAAAGIFNGSLYPDYPGLLSE